MPGSATETRTKSFEEKISERTHQLVHVPIITAEDDHRLLADEPSADVTFVVSSIDLSRFFTKAENRDFSIFLRRSVLPKVAKP